MPTPSHPKPKKKKEIKKSLSPIDQTLKNIYPNISPLEARGDRPLQMTLEDQLNSSFTSTSKNTPRPTPPPSSGRRRFVRREIAPAPGSKKAASSKPLTTRSRAIRPNLSGLYRKPLRSFSGTSGTGGPAQH